MILGNNTLLKYFLGATPLNQTAQQQQIPNAITPLLDSYLSAFDQEMPNFLIGWYLHGSIVLGAFDPHRSDIDFIAVVSRRCTTEDIASLKSIHQHLAKQYPDWQLEGSYLQTTDLGKFADSIEPCPYYHDGVLHPSGHHDINAVTWWILKNKGLTLRGENAQDLDFSVNWDSLITQMRQNLNSYWLKWTTDPTRILSLLFDDNIQWAVLGVLRQFYTFQEHTITSKSGAGEYALQKLPVEWHPIIQEALNIRNQSDKRLFRTRISRMIKARRFIKHIIHTSNSMVD